jgi:hypothetical protein
MSIHQFFKQDDNNFFHSSTYAKVARGEQLGTMSVQPFTDRNQVDRNRKMVKRYHDSIVARQQSHASGLTRIDVVLPTSRVPDDTASPSRQQSNTIPARPSVAPMRAQTFHEPPTRGYNPYG